MGDAIVFEGADAGWCAQSSIEVWLNRQAVPVQSTAHVVRRVALSGRGPE